MSLLGIDIGTTGCKAIVFRVDGQVLGHAYREYPLIHPREGWAELDPEGVWASVSEAVGQAVDRAGPGDPVKALATSVQGEAVTPVARDGTILANSPVTFDGRTVPYVEEWEKKVGREEIFRITGMPPGAPVGVVPPDVAEELGLPPGVAGATGGHDQPCGALGAGINRPGLAMDATGTVECITPIFDRPVLSPQMQEGNYCCYHHVVPGLYATLAFNFTGGSLLRWYRDNLGAKEVEEAQVSGLDVYDIMIGKAAGGPSRLLVLPHFTMTGTPW